MSFEKGKTNRRVAFWTYLRKFGTSHICFMQLAGLRKKLCYKNEMWIYGWISLVDLLHSYGQSLVETCFHVPGKDCRVDNVFLGWFS